MLVAEYVKDNSHGSFTVASISDEEKHTKKNEIHSLECLQPDELNQGRVEENLFQVQYVAPFSERQVGRSAARHVYVDLYNISYSCPANLPFILIIHKGLIIYNMSLVIRKQAFCICEHKDADQLRRYREADQRLCFHYTDSTTPLLPINEISSL